MARTDHPKNIVYVLKTIYNSNSKVMSLARFLFISYLCYANSQQKNAVFVLLLPVLFHYHLSIYLEY